MSPFLPSGTEVSLHWFSEGSGPQVGDVVLCRDPLGVWVLHRLVAFEPGLPPRWILKGDRGFLAESRTRQELWGKVTAYRTPGRMNPQPFRVGPLDRLIARTGRWSLRTPRALAAPLRRLTRLLSWFRRWT